MKVPAQLIALACAFLALWPVIWVRSEDQPVAFGELAAGGSRRHPLSLEAGRRYRIEVEQHAIDLAVVVRDPAGAELLALDGPLERWGTESGLFTAPPSGQVEVEVRSSQAGVGAGRYRLRVERFEAVPSEFETAELAWTRASASDDPETALAGFRTAAAGFAALGLAEREAAARHAAGALERRLGRSAEAREPLRRALELWRQTGVERAEAAALNDLGLAAWELGELAEADGSFAQAEELLARLGSVDAEADAGQNRCLVLHARGELARAVDCYETARDRFRQLGETRWEATALNNLGYAYFSLGEPTPALDDYRAALERRRALGDRRGEAQTLNNLAVVYRGLGELDAALAAYDAARSLQQALGDRRQEAATLSNLGVVYRDLGDRERARVYFEQALAVRTALGDRRGEIVTLGHLGELRCAGGETAAGLALLDAALVLARATDDGRGVGRLEGRRGKCLAENGDRQAGRAALEEGARRLGAAGDRVERAAVEQRLAELLLGQGQSREALVLLRQTLDTRLAAGETAGAAATRATLARAALAEGDWPTARAEAEAALEAIETLRLRLASPALRAVFLAARREAYEVLVGALAAAHRGAPAAGYDRAAFEVSEKARSRTLLDLLEQSRAELGRGFDPAQLAARRELRRRLYLKADRQQRADPAAARTLELEIAEILRRLEMLEAQMRGAGPRYAALVEPPIPSPGALRTLLGDDTVLLEVLTGERRSWLWRVDGESLTLHELPGRAELEPVVRRLHESWSRPASAGPRPAETAAAELSGWLLEPVWPELTRSGRVRRIAFAADGALHLLPLAALPMPDGSGQPLLTRFEVLGVPSAAALAAERRLRAPGSAPRRALVLADPVFDARDPRLATSPPAGAVPREAGFDRLAFSAQEARAIAALDPAAVEVRSGVEARAADLLERDLSGYGFLHVATHGVVDTERPELSGLVLAQFDAAGQPVDGRLRLADVYDLGLAAELVVLSGCRTALGRELRGEGLQGLARGFLHAGARSVAASLWAVQDRAATELMASLYRHLWREGLAPAAALRAAQLELRAHPRWRAPFYWAPWVLQGDWRE